MQRAKTVSDMNSSTGGPAFNARAARAKRPMPIWADAFHRETQHLAADELGALLMLLLAMWSRESCDLPDDDARLARIARVSLTQWKRRIGPSVRALLRTEGGFIFSKRLQKEADFVEHGVQLQSDRKKGKSGGNQLKNNDSCQSADRSPDHATDHPAQEPNDPTLTGGDGCANAREADPPVPDSASLRERLLAAMGLGPDGVAGPTKFLGGQADMAEAARWLALPGITEDVAITEVAKISARKTGGFPNSFKYFTPGIQRLSDALTAPSLQIGTPRAPPAPPRATRIRARLPSEMPPEN